MFKKHLSLLLIISILLFAFLPAMSASAEGPEPAAEAEASEEISDIVILFTSDVHCAYDQGFTLAGLQQVRDYLRSQGNAVILADNGDSIQGGPAGTVSKGQIPFDLMNDMGYEIAIPGNHEFDYGANRFMELAEGAAFEYISCNITRNGELVFPPYTIREIGGRKIAFVGITTPRTILSSAPARFTDENGNVIYDFMQGDGTGKTLYDAVQKAADDARAEGAEYVIVMAHLGLGEDCRPWTYADVIANTNGIDAFLDGHSHDSEQIIMKNKDGKEIPRSACGTMLEGIGWCRIPVNGAVTAGLYTWSNDTAADKLLMIDNEMETIIAGVNASLEEFLMTRIGTAPFGLMINDPEAVDNNGLPIRMVRRAETNLGDFCTDALRSQTGADISILNSGAIRSELPAGEVTYSSILTFAPFSNSLSVIEATGQQILDALEWGARAVPGETGAFLQVSGMTLEIDSSIDSPCLVNNDLAFGGISGERRVRNVLVGGEPIDPEKIYTIASTDYLLLQEGDGFNMFNGCPVLQEGSVIDNQVYIDYLSDTMGGIVSGDYADPTGDGRIVVLE